MSSFKRKRNVHIYDTEWACIALKSIADTMMKIQTSKIQ